jgi:hypothetical protein
MLYHNYRRLLDTLDSEIKRYGRSGRSFGVLLIDLDGLKKINDAHGMLWGAVLSAVWPTLFEFIAVKLTLLLDMKETNLCLCCRKPRRKPAGESRNGFPSD